MKRLRIAIVIFFVITASVYAFYKYHDRRVEDKTPPVITADSDTVEMSVFSTEEDLLSGIRAIDDKDGDVSDSLLIVNRTPFITDHTVKIHYAAFDSGSNVATYTRSVTYTDYVHPRLSIREPLVFTAKNSRTNYLDNITCTDCLDGDITSQIKLISSEVSSSYYSSSSSVELLLQVTNSVGDTQTIPLTARIQSGNDYLKERPAFNDYIWYTPVSQRVDFYALLSGVWTNGTVKSFEETGYGWENIVIDDSQVNYDTPGTYIVSISLRRDEEIVGTTDFYIVVED